MAEWSFIPGNSLALITEQFALVLSEAEEQSFVDRVLSATTAAEALDALLAGGLSAAPDFCLCTITDGTVQAYVRGDCSLRVEGDWVESATVTGVGVRSWREVAYDGVSRVAMIAPDSAVATRTSIRTTQPERIPAKPGVHQVSMLVYEHRQSGISMLTAELPRLTRADAVTPPPKHAAEPVLEAFPDDLFGPAPAPEPTQNLEAGLNYDELFGETQNVSIEQAAVRAGEQQDSEHKDLTGDEHIAAVLCSEGHANPPEREHCGVCGGVLLSEEMVRVATPSFGNIVLPDATEVPIEGVLLLGRSPRADAAQATEIVPTLVTVHDPNGDVSRTHIRVSVEGWSVLIEDLRTTNGTVLESLDGSAKRLRAGEPRAVAEGDTADLGGGVRIQFRGVA